jgi:two-component system, cell cycle response regulator DivK
MDLAPRALRKRRREAPLVLVVDDYEDNRIMYTEYLAYAGFRVIEAADGEEAILKAARLHPDVVVMDLSLPGIDGWEATRAIKADKPGMPVIALTGFSMSHAQSAREAGCDDFITKPCLPNALLEALERHLRKRGPGLLKGRVRNENRAQVTKRLARRR